MDLNKEIEEIKKRNKRVELDKAWETSLDQRNMYLYINLYCSCSLFLYSKKL